MADPISNLPGEVWKPVVGWERFYEVSNLGRVKRLRREQPHPSMRQRLIHPELIMKPHLKGKRNTLYPQVTLQVGTNRKYANVHRLVLEAFVGPCPAGMESLHIDSNSHNPRLDNLRWG